MSISFGGERPKRCRRGGPARPRKVSRQRQIASMQESLASVQSLARRHSGMVSLLAKHRLSVASHTGSCESKRRHSSLVPVGHGVRQTPSRHTAPVAQSASTSQNGRGVQSGRQNSSVPHKLAVLQVPVSRQSAKQRPSTQWESWGQSADVWHWPGAGRQNPSWQLSPAPHTSSEEQISVQRLSTQARPAAHW